MVVSSSTTGASKYVPPHLRQGEGGTQPAPGQPADTTQFPPNNFAVPPPQGPPPPGAFNGGKSCLLLAM